MRNFGKFSKINFTTFLNSFIFQFPFSLFSFTSKPFLNLFFKSFLNVFNLNQIHTIKRNKCTGIYAQTCCYLMMNFNLMKNFIFLFFMSTKFRNKSFETYFQKRQFLGCYNSTPLRWISSSRFGRCRLGDRIFCSWILLYFLGLK